MPLPTHLKPLPTKHDQSPGHVQEHPLSISHPTSPTHHQMHHDNRHPHFEEQQSQQYRQYHQPHSPRQSDIHPHETDPMLPPHTQHDIHHHRQSHEHQLHSHNNNNQSHSRTETHHNNGVTLGHHRNSNLSATREQLPIPPPKSPKSPKSPTPLSKRLLYALTNKPTLSRTWEKRTYVEQQKSAPLNGQMSPGRHDSGMGFQEYSSPRSRPISFYASPAEIAAFKPLPMVDNQYPHENNGTHAHSAPNLPAPLTRV